jgi:hypothetical protein
LEAWFGPGLEEFSLSGSSLLASGPRVELVWFLGPIVGSSSTQTSWFFSIRWDLMSIDKRGDMWLHPGNRTFTVAIWFLGPVARSARPRGHNGYNFLGAL